MLPVWSQIKVFDVEPRVSKLHNGTARNDIGNVSLGIARFLQRMYFQGSLSSLVRLVVYLKSFFSSYLERMHHGACEAIGVFATGEIEAVDMPRVAPLVERGGSLVVLESADDAAVYYHLERREQQIREMLNKF